jgi:competence protein ComEA
MKVRTLGFSLLAACLLLPAFAAAESTGVPTPAQPAGVVNINTASATQIALLPRVGLKVAERVIEYRKANGPFRKVEDLMEVKGIGERLFVTLKPHLTLSGDTTLTQKIKSTGMRARAQAARAAKKA